MGKGKAGVFYSYTGSLAPHDGPSGRTVIPSLQMKGCLGGAEFNGCLASSRGSSHGIAVGRVLCLPALESRN